MKNLIIVILCAVVAVSLYFNLNSSIPKVTEEPEVVTEPEIVTEEKISDEELIIISFNNYKTAILSDDGEAAVKCLSQSTVDGYENYRKWALTARKKELLELSLINRLQVLIMRHRISKEELQEMDGSKLLIYAVEKGWVGKNSVMGLEAGEAKAQGTTGVLNVIVNGQIIKQNFTYVKEDGAWKNDLMRTMQLSSLALAQVARKSGFEENDFIMHLVETVSGKKPHADIWNSFE